MLNALKWLKIHNVHYHDIVIAPSRLNWMKDVEEAIIPVTVEEHCFDKDTNSIKQLSNKETILSIQTEFESNDNDGLEYCGILPSYIPFSSSSQQEKGMSSIKESMTKISHGEGLMNFPPTDTYDPIE